MSAHVTRDTTSPEWTYWVTCGECAWQTPPTHLERLAAITAWAHNRATHGEDA